MPEESLIMDFATGRLIFFGALLYYIRVIHTVIFNTLFLTERDCYG
jgi:hypothetical protein